MLKAWKKLGNKIEFGKRNTSKSKNFYTVTLPVTLSNATDKDIDKKENKNIIDTVVSMYNETCVSFPKCTAVSEKRKKSIKAHLNNGYTVEDFKTVFDKAEASTFLKGGNKNDWKATFDWLISDGNFAKVLDGNYDNTSHFVDYSDPNRYSQKGW